MLEFSLRRPNPILHRLQCLNCRSISPRHPNSNANIFHRNASTKSTIASRRSSSSQRRWQHTDSEPHFNNRARTRAFSHIQDLISRLRLRFILPITSHPLFRATWPPLKYLLYAFPIFKVVETHMGQVVWINGASMYPALNAACYEDPRTSEPVWVDRRKPALGLERGMIVAFRSPLNPEHEVVKRIVALPGDLIMIRTAPDHGTPMSSTPSSLPPPDENSVQHLSPFSSKTTHFPHPQIPRSSLARLFAPFSSSTPTPGPGDVTSHPTLQPIVIPYNHIWLEGDNPDPTKTLDSHTYGPVSMSMITGKVAARLEWRWKDSTYKSARVDPDPELGGWWSYSPWRVRELKWQRWEGSQRTLVAKGVSAVEAPYNFQTDASH